MTSLILFIDFSIVSTALPAIQLSFEMSFVELQWVMNVVVLTVCIFMVNMGKLGDFYGNRLLLYLGSTLFGVATLMAGLSTSGTMLIVFRGLQGLSIATLTPACLALIRNTFPDNEQGKAIGIWTSTTGVGLAVGPVLGGIITSALSWRWIFFVNIPVLIIGIFICLVSVREIKHQSVKRTIDWLGFFLMIVGIGPLITALIQDSEWGWASSTTIIFFVVGVVSLIAFTIVEKRVATPILDFNLLLNRSFLSGALANFTVIGFGWAAFFLMPIYLGNIVGEDALYIGFFLLPITVLIILIAPISGRMVDNRGAKLPILIGLAALAASGLVQATFGVGTEPYYIIFGFLLMGTGWGFIYGSGAFAAISSLPKEQAGTATGALWTFQNLGGASCLAIAGIIFRHMERKSLDNGLSSSGINLTEQQSDMVDSLLSDPDKSRHVLSQFTDVTTDKILPIFENSFMKGYNGAFIFLFGLSVLSFILIFFIMKDLKRGKSE